MKKRFTFLFPTAVVGALRTRFFWLGCLVVFSVAASAQTTTGTYKPTTGSDRTIWFNMKNNVKI
ncbi:hypothetical protein [Larkinella sp.]|uniref:hypothetical protein n=1 Tax=Larkinella sp. TaxID=2034517 RepID=UPI003BA95664